MEDLLDMTTLEEDNSRLEWDWNHSAGLEFEAALFPWELPRRI